MDKKSLQKSTKEKRSYLKYFEAARKRGSTPMTWGKWKKSKDIESTHLSGQSQGQLSTLSQGDYAEVMKMLKRKK